LLCTKEQHSVGVLGQPIESRQSVCVGADSEIEFSEAKQAILDMDIDLGARHAAACPIRHRELHRTGSSSTVYDRNRLARRRLSGVKWKK
jgi:hypothetical protein